VETWESTKGGEGSTLVLIYTRQSDLGRDGDFDDDLLLSF